MNRPAPDRPGSFVKPAYWTDTPPPPPAPIDPELSDPAGPNPTRYGDWVKKGLAIDF